MYEQYPIQNIKQEPQPQTLGTPQNGRSRKSAAALLCACLVTSGVMGFGGGYLAAMLRDVPAPGTVAAAPAIPEAQVAAVPAPAAPVTGMSVSQVVNAVSDSVVEISTNVQTTNFFMQTVTAQAAGSGVIIREDGYIVTNHHVVDGATDITIRLKNGESYPAELVGSDPQTDLAVVKIEADGLSAAKIGSSSALQVGDETVAIGNSLGELGGTVTNGIVSALNREITVGNETMSLLQTNAAISPGNSGGGLFNDQGELIGIVVAKASGSNAEGLGFAIPIDTAKKVADDLMASGYVTGRGELGISALDVTDERTAFYYRVPQLGVYIAGVQDGSSAQQAGLRVGDGIVAVNDAEVESTEDLRRELQKHRAGDTVRMTVLRDGSRQSVSVTLQEAVPESVKAENMAA